MSIPGIKRSLRRSRIRKAAFDHTRPRRIARGTGASRSLSALRDLMLRNISMLAIEYKRMSSLKQ